MYRKLRLGVWFLHTFLKRYFLVLSGGIVLGVAVFGLVPLLTRSLSIIRPTQNIGLVGRHTLTTLPKVVESKLSIGLTTVDSSGVISPGLADSWEISEDGKSYTFSINPSFTWHDRASIKSEDIGYNFKDAAVEYSDSTHLTIRLSDPFSPLPAVVSAPVLKKTKSPTKLIGVGSYQVTRFRRNGQILESITLTPADTTSSRPKINYLFYPTQAQAITAFKLGIVDQLEDITDPGELATWPTAVLDKRPQSDRYVAVFFNLTDPLFAGSSGEDLRLALSYATDKSRFDSALRAISPIAATSWAFNPEVKKYDHDLTRAQELLKRTEKLPENITLSVVQAYLEVGEEIKKDWEELGLKVNLQISPDIPETFQALIVAQSIPVDPDQYHLWHSTQGTNLTHLNNPRIDKLLEDGRKTLDLKDRKKIYADFQRYLLEEAPAIFLFHPETYTITRK